MGKSRQQNKSRGASNKVVKPAYGEVIIDRDGNRVGDDGYPMTPARTRLHKLLDIVLIFGYLCIAVAVIVVVWALFQGQSYTADSFIAYGGNEYMGYSVASLMRGEALVVFLIGMICIIISHRAMAWLYDGKDAAAVRYLMVGLIVLALGWCSYLFWSVRLVDPISCVYAVLAILTYKSMNDVGQERKTLKPSVFTGKDGQ